MGIYDREYYRDEPRGILLTGQRSVVVNLILVNAAVFLLELLLQHGDGYSPLASYFALHADVFQTWYLWQFVTAGFLHADFFHLLFNMLALYFFGRDVELIHGRKTFIQLYFSTLILSNLCWVLSENYLMGTASTWAVGASGAIAGVVVVFVCHFPTRLIYLWGVVPVPAWLMATVWLAYDMFNFRQAVGGFSTANVAFAAHLSGAVCGLIYYYFRVTLFSVLPTSWLSSGMKRLKRQPQLRIHDPEGPDDTDLEERVDSILAKIHEHGSDSLTPEERRILQKASQRAQQRRRYELNK